MFVIRRKFVIILKREFERKTCSFSDGTLDFYFSIVCVDHCFHITQSQSKTFYIMHVSCMGTIKFFKYPSLRFFIHSNSIVFNAENKVFTGTVRRDLNIHMIPEYFTALSMRLEI